MNFSNIMELPLAFFHVALKNIVVCLLRFIGLYSLLLLLCQPSLFFVPLVLVLLSFDSTPRSVGPVLGGHPGWSVLRAPGTRQSSQWFSVRVTLPHPSNSEDIWQCLGTFLVITNRAVLLALHG